jgi:carbamoyltransferase
MGEYTYVLGISAFYHDSAAALLRDGEIVAAAQEERFTRKKNDQEFPRHAARYCLRESGLSIEDVQLVAFYDQPLLKFDRLLDSYLKYAPAGLKSFKTAMRTWLGSRGPLDLPRVIRSNLGCDGDIVFAQHHESHAASAFFPSPFDRAAVLCIDGVGEWATTTWGIGEGARVQLCQQIRYPHSLGMLYSAFTYYTGFKVNSGEYKLMGLAPYGAPKYAKLIERELVHINDDGSIILDMKYFNYEHGQTMTNSRFHDLFGGEPRPPETLLTQKEMDLAASIQVVLERAVLALARHVHRHTNAKCLCMAGGVALNCVANARLLREGPFDDVWIQPAAGDAGGALGAALVGWHHYLGKPRRRLPTGADFMQGAFLGPSYSTDEIKRVLRRHRSSYRELDLDALCREIARRLADGQIIGWFQGRMEFGPRALGARSILGDARQADMQRRMNLKIKHRESFRPFAPSVLSQYAQQWFDWSGESPYMMFVAPVKDEMRIAMSRQEEALFGIEKLNLRRSLIPAVTHLDYSARIQTVDGKHNRVFWQLLTEFNALTGCPLIVNTSFNVRGEPIVCTPEDAYRCFMQTDIDALVLENLVLEKGDQPVFSEELTREPIVLD